MNRREAIQLVIDLSDHTFGRRMADRGLDDQTRAALRALGVTDAEIDEVEKG